MRYQKYFTKYQLWRAAENGPRWGYNRQLDPDQIATMPDLDFPVVQTLVHEHRDGEPCEQHMRCVVLVSRTIPEDPEDSNCRTDMAIVDVPMEVYQDLPEYVIEDEELPHG
jgi:hypothetical protein